MRRKNLHDLIKDLAYNKADLESELSQELESQYEKGQISKEIYKGTKGTTSPNGQGMGRRDTQNGSSQSQSTGLTSSGP